MTIWLSVYANYTESTYLLTSFFIEPEIILRIDPSVEYDREVIEREVSKSMGMVDSYLKKFDKPNVEVRIEVFIKKNVDNSFHGELHANANGRVIVFKREAFMDLHDLIHHAFQHLKEQLAAK